MNVTKNYKEHWIIFFSDEKRFKIEIEEINEFEIIRVSSPNLINQSIIELRVLSSDGLYLDMETIRFFHPLNSGFNNLQSESDEFSNEEGEFNEKNIKSMEKLIDNYLQCGVSETVYSYNKSDFKSEITQYKDNKEINIVWIDKGHMASSKIQRFLNKSFIIKRFIKGQAWV